MSMHSKRDTVPDNGNMYAYFMIVNGIINTIGSDGIPRPRPSVLGAMWDIEKRKGTAVFYKNQTIRNDSVAYLRTSAHEIGHQFNLHHRDGSVTQGDGSQKKFSIMNQTGVISEYGGWPSGVSLEFGPFESKHLSQHTLQFVAPGKSKFDGKCDGEHDAWHDEAPTRLGVSGGDLTEFDEMPIKLDFQIQMGKEKYLPGQPAICYLKITNKGSEDVELIDKLVPEYNTVKFYVKKENQEEQRFIPYVFYEFIAEKTKVKPGDSIYGRAKIFYGSNGYTFEEPSNYQVRAEYHGIDQGVGKIIRSNSIEVVVRAPKDKEEEEQVRLIKGKEQALFFLFEGGDHLVEAISQLSKLAEQHPRSVLSSYANAVLGLHWSREFKDFKNKRVRKAEYNTARAFLETALDNVDGYWANAAYLNLSEIYRKTGDKVKAKSILDEYIGKFEGQSKNTNGINTAKQFLDDQLL